jgi:hypothetical protein
MEILNGNLDSRLDFNDTWLCEMPQRIKSRPMLSDIVNSIVDALDYSNKPPVNFGNGYYKLQGSQIVYYWYKEQNINMAIELSIKPQGFMVNGVGKSPDCPIYASEFYEFILKDIRNLNINSLLFSDIQMTDDGKEIWDRLLNDGHKILIYDVDNPTNIFVASSINDLDKYFDDDLKYQNYRFILSESTNLWEVKAFFNTRRMRELAGMDVK